ncbi:hypothetical protein [Sphingomonas sp. S2-65]|uniref:hypothetical protein n=1 Tax=Sphingomonas sp. S2-65 TaxID=2903960 RepID=UPI001F18D1A6|nr:hypothetical protein [Sphingomonas sp. S2-65]UYY59349.1 hypothetical protein LZ586_04500 [Sphingomonas sp. S2-65]
MEEARQHPVVTWAHQAANNLGVLGIVFLCAGLAALFFVPKALGIIVSLSWANQTFRQVRNAVVCGELTALDGQKIPSEEQRFRSALAWRAALLTVWLVMGGLQLWILLS